jgi:hypothetical protein
LINEKNIQLLGDIIDFVHYLQCHMAQAIGGLATKAFSHIPRIVEFLEIQG